MRGIPSIEIVGFALLSGTSGFGQTTELVSVDSSGVQGNDDSERPAITGDGRFVAFESDASNLALGDTNGDPDVFVYDRQTGTTVCASVAASGNPGDRTSWRPSVSGDGRFAAFYSLATNLVPGDTNGKSDIFVHDRNTGATELVSVDSSANQGNGNCALPVITPGGRYVAFSSYASNLVLGDTNNELDVFVHDRQTGATERVSVSSSGVQGFGYSDDPRISDDGRCVAFISAASTLVPGDTNLDPDIFVHDRQTGLTELVSVDSSGVQGSAFSASPSISADGRRVTFVSGNVLVPGDTNGDDDIFVHDRQTGATELVSVDSSGNEGNLPSGWSSSISADGRHVAFQSRATNLVPGDTNLAEDVFVRDRGCGSGSFNYCTAGTSASGCSASISAAGAASTTASSGFVVTASKVEGLKDGLFFYGQNGRQANPWGNGTSYQCVVPPTKRAGMQPGSGTAGLCDGVIDQDLNALWCPGCGPSQPPTVGKMQLQFWYRDPLSTSNQKTSLSDALEVEVCP